MTCIKITEYQNGQIYPEDTFSHGAAHIYLCRLLITFENGFDPDTKCQA